MKNHHPITPSQSLGPRPRSLFEAEERGHFRGWQEDHRGVKYPFCVCPECGHSYLLMDYPLRLDKEQPPTYHTPDQVKDLPLRVPPLT